MSSPIVVIQGGLGNQLSQWSFAHVVSEDKNFQLDPLDGLGSAIPREFELLAVLNNCSHVGRDAFGFLVEPSNLAFYHVLDRLWELKPLRRLVEKLGYVREDPRLDQEQTSKFPAKIKYAKGYFQKQQNVEEILDLVRSEIIPVVQTILPKVINKFGLGENYSVLHVRRGDYESTYFTPTIIGTLSDEYFLNGVTKFDSSKLIILTEDQSDVTELIQILVPDVVLDKNDTSPWETLAIMYGATNFLGSNSSLSWWGARVCAIRGGKVWLPSQWSYWKNINIKNYHFPSCKVADVFWKQGSSEF
jgi:hypothetical protein